MENESRLEEETSGLQYHIAENVHQLRNDGNTNNYYNNNSIGVLALINSIHLNGNASYMMSLKASN